MSTRAPVLLMSAGHGSQRSQAAQELTLTRQDQVPLPGRQQNRQKGQVPFVVTELCMAVPVGERRNGDREVGMDGGASSHPLGNAHNSRKRSQVDQQKSALNSFLAWGFGSSCAFPSNLFTLNHFCM